jgi:undecaprenyl-diphosphatase
MLSFFQAIILGAVQGITELFPVSSLGHSVLLPGLLGWRIDQNANDFITFLVATHFATAIVLFSIYWKDWKQIIAGIFRSFADREIRSADGKLGWLLIVATVPAGIAGVLFEEQVKQFFVSPVAAAFFLVLNGCLLFAAEWMRKKAKEANRMRNGNERITNELSWGKAISIGCAQAIALIPGFSRTGSTLAGGLTVGLSHEDALRFSFLLATPIIFAAALLKLPPLLLSGSSHAIQMALVGATTAAIGAYFSAKFLVRYFKTKTLTPFATYCVVLGVVSLLLLR